LIDWLPHIGDLPAELNAPTAIISIASAHMLLPLGESERYVY
jgi:hypothetical protein